MRKLTLFIAAPLARCDEADRVRLLAIRAGYRVRATWIDQARAAGVKEELTEETAALAIARNDSDLYAAEAVLALCWPGEGREMWSEVGRATLIRTPVVIVRGSSSTKGSVKTGHLPLGAYRPGVRICDTVDDALIVLDALC